MYIKLRGICNEGENNMIYITKYNEANIYAIKDGLFIITKHKIDKFPTDKHYLKFESYDKVIEYLNSNFYNGRY